MAAYWRCIIKPVHGLRAICGLSMAGDGTSGISSAAASGE